MSEPCVEHCRISSPLATMLCPSGTRLGNLTVHKLLQRICWAVLCAEAISAGELSASICAKCRHLYTPRMSCMPLHPSYAVPCLSDDLCGVSKISCAHERPPPSTTHRSRGTAPVATAMSWRIAALRFPNDGASLLCDDRAARAPWSTLHTETQATETTRELRHVCNCARSALGGVRAFRRPIDPTGAGVECARTGVRWTK